MRQTVKEAKADMSDPVKNNSSNREKSGAESARTRSTNENSAGKMPRKRKKHSLSFNAVLMLVILAVGLGRRRRPYEIFSGYRPVRAEVD